MNDDGEHETEESWWGRHRQSLGVSLFSACLHLLLLCVLAMVILPNPPYDLTNYLTIRTDTVSNDSIDAVENLIVTPDKLNEGANNSTAALALNSTVVSDQPSQVSMEKNQEQLQWKVEAFEFLGQNLKNGEFSGRSEAARSLLTKAFGGSTTSEKAVNSGLDWLKRHQNEDGSWNFDHTRKECEESCTSPGNLRNNPLGATSLALLCFVGAGHTHEKGKYVDVVKKGMNYLAEKYIAAEEPGDMRGLSSGNSGMYVQGITTIVLCELYGLTRDRRLRKMAQGCVDFILDAQHPENGGWRYRIMQEDGDTSVVGWQVMALTSARMSGLTVPGRAKVLAERFLTSVQLEEGAFYGYARPEKKASTTAIGLLCRMYYGWDEMQPALKVGVKYLSEVGPSNDNQYYNYYATQVLYHTGGDTWEKWNRVMREKLIKSQETAGHAAGSWAPRDPHGRSGGRHYGTCLSILTLEVYYRHLPLYQRRRFQTEF